MRRRPDEARRRHAEFARLELLGVTPRAAYVIADAVAVQPWLRGDTAAAYARHRRAASPLARAAHAAQARADRVERGRVAARRRA